MYDLGFLIAWFNTLFRQGYLNQAPWPCTDIEM